MLFIIVWMTVCLCMCDSSISVIIILLCKEKNVYKTNSAVFYNLFFFVCNMNVKKIRYEMLCL